MFDLSDEIYFKDLSFVGQCSLPQVASVQLVNCNKH